MARIYIETTIAGFYYEVRTEPEMVACRNWTRRWFDVARAGSDELVTSLAVEAELEAGDFFGKADAVASTADLPLVNLNDSVAEAVEAYISHMVTPNNLTGDALHLAATTFYRCDFLVTWNCRHLANAKKFGHIRHVQGIWGWAIPRWSHH